jgi:glycosyltransferase involved in cell wall biosynthesis
MTRNRPAAKRDIIVRYVGLHGIAQGLDQIVLAARDLSHLEHLQIELIGDGPEKQSVIQMAQELRLKNIHFRDPVPHSQVIGLLHASDICLVPLKLHLTGAVPSKLYEAMAVGKPVVLVAKGEAAEIVRQHACGLVVEPGDIDGLSDAIRRLASDPEKRKWMGINGRRAAVEHFDRKKIAVRFAEFLRVQMDNIQQ